MGWGDADGNGGWAVNETNTMSEAMDQVGPAKSATLGTKLTVALVASMVAIVGAMFLFIYFVM